MKKYLLVLILLISSIFSFSSLITFAQEISNIGDIEFKKEQEDYLFQFNKYNIALEQYDTAKKAYEKHGTINSQQEAIAKTKQVLIYRAEALRSYLQVIKVILDQQTSLDIFLKNAQFGKIEATQSFLNTHKQNIERSLSITEVNSESARLEREATSIDDLAYETLSVILIGRTQDLEKRERVMIEDVERRDNLPDDIKLGISEAKKKLTEIRLVNEETIQMVHEYQEAKTSKSRLARKKASSLYRDIKKEIVSAKEILKEVAIIINEMKGKLGDE